MFRFYARRDGAFACLRAHIPPGRGGATLVVQCHVQMRRFGGRRAMHARRVPNGRRPSHSRSLPEPGPHADGTPSSAEKYFERCRLSASFRAVHCATATSALGRQAPPGPRRLTAEVRVPVVRRRSSGVRGTVVRRTSEASTGPRRTRRACRHRLAAIGDGRRQPALNGIHVAPFASSHRHRRHP
jgi:hypothetical protein